MPRKYQKYDIATKVSLVEEYLNICKTTKITKANYAYEKGISDSTFNDWVIKYLKDKDKFINGTSNDDDNVSIVSCVKPTFIELTKDNLDTKANNNDSASLNNIKLSYKDVTLEFNNDQLEMVLGIIKRW